MPEVKIAEASPRKAVLSRNAPDSVYGGKSVNVLLPLFNRIGWRDELTLDAV